MYLLVPVTDFQQSQQNDEESYDGAHNDDHDDPIVQLKAKQNDWVSCDSNKVSFHATVLFHTAWQNGEHVYRQISKNRCPCF